MSTNRILIMADDLSLSDLLLRRLHVEGYETMIAADGYEALRKFQNVKPALVLLDLAMCVMDGWEVCRRIRKVANTPILMLTDQMDGENIKRGLDHGADDYLLKPFCPRVLMARIRTLLHPVCTKLEVNWSQTTYNDEYLNVNLSTRQVTVNGASVKLTPTEYKLLAYLVLHQGRTLEFRHILENVWGFRYSDALDYLRVYIWHLRRKIEPNPKHPIYLLNEMNVGYRFKSI
jgi:two-component system, OmpR family, KDP operon response regulator KdpE